MGAIEELRSKVTFEGRKLQENIFHKFSKMVKKRSKISYRKIELLKKLPKNWQKIPGYRFRSADSKYIVFTILGQDSRTIRFQIQFS